MMDDYCLECHKDAYDGWFHSAHHLSSFNNKAYLTSVRETRKVALERDGSTQASRWCAAATTLCRFSRASLTTRISTTCTTRPARRASPARSATRSPRSTTPGATRAYTIEEPQHYPFAFSDNPILKWINLTLVKAKPEMHKKDVLEADHQGRRVLLGVPQGRAAVSPSLTTKTSSAGQDHYNTLPALGRFRPRSAELLLSRRSRSPTATSATWTCWPRTTSGPGTSTARASGRSTITCFPAPTRLCRTLRRRRSDRRGAREVPRRTRKSGSTSSHCARAA